MKIKVDSEKIVKAVKKLDGIEIVLENAEDAKSALDLILRKSEWFHGEGSKQLKDINVTSYQRYETSAVDYKMVFLLHFVFEDHASMDTRVEVVKELQTYFGKV